MSKHSKTIRRLEESVNALKSTVNALATQQRELRLQSWLASVSVAHCDALLELGAALELHGHGGCAHAASPPRDNGNAGGACGQTAALRQVRRMNQDAAEAGGAPGGGGGLPPLGWDPSRAAADFRAGRCDVSTAGLRRALRSYVSMAGVMLSHIHSGSPNAAACRAALRAAHGPVLELACIGVLTGELLPLSEVLTEPLTADDYDDRESKLDRAAAGGRAAPAPAGRRGAPAGARPPPAAEVADEHWLFAARRLQLDPEQEEKAVLLLRGIAAQTSALHQGMARVLEKCSGPDVDLEERERLLASMSDMQRCYQVVSVVTYLVLHGSILSVEQVSDYLIGAWPYMPSLTGLRKSLEIIREERTAAADAAAAAAQPLPAAASSGAQGPLAGAAGAGGA